mmetsp:Transcript_40715/g.100597  ORF Transcript_40715/g.100597 Transcript_40715/m.100597 type:complete len:397 (+) Transcript_40715:43-1233(+)
MATVDPFAAMAGAASVELLDFEALTAGLGDEDESDAASGDEDAAAAPVGLRASLVPVGDEDAAAPSVGVPTSPVPAPTVGLSTTLVPAAEAAAPAPAAARPSRLLLCAQCFSQIARGSDVLCDRLPANPSTYAYNLDLSLGADDNFWCYQLSMRDGNRADVITLYSENVETRIEEDLSHVYRAQPTVQPVAAAAAAAPAAAAGAPTAAIASLEKQGPEVWFEGYAQERARCRTCKAHVGWLFTPVVPMQSATYSGMFPPGMEPLARPFAGLIVTKLKPQDANATLSEEIDKYVAEPGNEVLANELAISTQLRMEMTMEDARQDIGNKNDRTMVGALLVGQLQKAIREGDLADGEEDFPEMSAAEKKSKNAMDALRMFTIGLANKLADHDDDSDGDQ